MLHDSITLATLMLIARLISAIFSTCRYKLPLAFGILLLLSGPLAAQTTATLVRIAVLDTSGSMAGERLKTAKAELLAQAERLPPSKDKPLILIPFHRQPHDVGTFTDLQSFKAHLAKITASGGTSIASGLNRGVEMLEPYKGASHICFLLYTDGEDTDQTGINTAEEKLNRFFATRSKQGLSSLLFCKRWEGANAALLAKIASGGHAQVIDAKELTVVSVTLNPTVTVMRAAWAKDKALTLELECQTRLELHGMAYDPALPTATLTCTDPDAQLPPVMLRAGDPKPASFRMRLTVSPATASSGKATLHFTLGPLGPFSAKTAVLPFITHQISVPVTLPALQIQFAASVTTDQPSTWSDPLAAKPAQHLTLTCALQSDSSTQWPAPLTLRLKPDRCRLLSGQDTITVQGPGTQTLPITLEVDTVTPGTSTFTVALTVQAEAPASLQVDPPTVRLTSEAKLPSPLETRITTQVRTITDARWNDLVQGLATFDTQVTFEVTGPIPPGTKLVLVCPPAIRTIQVQPAVLQSGTQDVQLTIQARFPAAPNAAQFDLQVQPPFASRTVRFIAPPPLRLRVMGPAPVQLALLQADGANPRVIVRDRAAPVLLSGVPVLLGCDSADLSSGLAAVVQSGPTIPVQRSEPVPIGTPLALPLRLPELETSFFFDTSVEDTIEVLPSPASPALVGSRQRYVVTVEAPFKRLCFYLAVTLSAFLLIALLARLTLPLVKLDAARK
jgi:uncharacterized protein YegL